MSTGFNASANAVLDGVVASDPRVPGVVAMVTDRIATSTRARPASAGSIRTAEMTTDSVFAIFSTTKAITGTAILQLVEEGKLDLDAPAKTYAPDIGKLQVIEGFDASGRTEVARPRSAMSPRGC